MRLSISVGVSWNIFGIQGRPVPEKCILEAFGTGVPNGNVTVKKSPRKILKNYFSHFEIICKSFSEIINFSLKMCFVKFFIL